eukprot:m.133961 g.133961  ORF g.133961 m.133961 type:complete len:1019 (-) comp15964_c0_seq4:26-3082(-)
MNGSASQSRSEWASASRFADFDDDAAADDEDVFQHRSDVDEDTATLFEMLWGERLSSQSHVVNFGVAEIVALVKRSDLHYSNVDGVSFLHIAAAGNNTLFISHLIDNVGIAVNLADSLGRTPLHDAVAFGAAEAVQELLSQGADLYATGHTGESVLHTAARNDQAYMIIKLLQHSVNRPGHWHKDGGFIACQSETNRIQLQQDRLLAQTSLHRKSIAPFLHDPAPSSRRKRGKLLRKDSVTPSVLQHVPLPQRHTRATMESTALLEIQTKARRYLCPCCSNLPFETCHGEDLDLADLRTQTLVSTRVRGEILKLGNIYKSKENRYDLPSAYSLEQDQRIFRDLQDKHGRTALHLAAMLDRDSAAKTLMDLGADTATRNEYGVTALNAMVLNMPTVAAEALGSYDLVDRPSREQRYYLALLEPKPVASNLVVDSHHRSVLEQIVRYKRLGLISRPAILALLAFKWNAYARRAVLTNLALYVLHILLWTILATFNHEASLASYRDDRWIGLKITVLTGAVMTLMFFICFEILELYRKVTRFKAWREAELKLIKDEIDHTHEYSTDRKYFEETYKSVGSLVALSEYTSDYWNALDWVSYILLTVALIAHLVDIGNGRTKELSRAGQVAARFLVFGLIVSWLTLLKYARAFKVWGPFAVMLGQMLSDVSKFVFLYVVVLIPYSAGFMLIFGDSNDPDLRDYQHTDLALVTLFRMSLVDLDYDPLRNHDATMAGILVVSWLFLSGILFINLFIAMLSNTFQIVSDNAKNVAAMQRAETILAVENGMSAHELNELHTQLHQASTQEGYIAHYYDDPDEPDGADGLSSLRADILEEVAQQGEAMSRMESNVERLERRFKDMLRDISSSELSPRARRATMQHLSGLAPADTVVEPATNDRPSAAMSFQKGLAALAQSQPDGPAQDLARPSASLAVPDTAVRRNHTKQFPPRSVADPLSKEVTPSAEGLGVPDSAVARRRTKQFHPRSVTDTLSEEASAPAGGYSQAQIQQPDHDNYVDGTLAESDV